MTNKNNEAIDWSRVQNFTPGEFKEDPDLYADPELIYTLQDIRDVQYGYRIFPSPVSGALARFSGSTTSQHYVGPRDNPVRKSTAIDLYIEGVPACNLGILMSHPKIGGIGIYLDGIGVDGNPWVRFHMDLRKKGWKGVVPLLWIVSGRGVNAKTYYPQKNNKGWGLLKRDEFYKCRFKR